MKQLGLQLRQHAGLPWRWTEPAGFDGTNSATAVTAARIAVIASFARFQHAITANAPRGADTRLAGGAGTTDLDGTVGATTVAAHRIAVITGFANFYLSVATDRNYGRLSAHGSAGRCLAASGKTHRSASRCLAASGETPGSAAPAATLNASISEFDARVAAKYQKSEKGKVCDFHVLHILV